MLKDTPPLTPASPFVSPAPLALVPFPRPRPPRLTAWLTLALGSPWARPLPRPRRRARSLVPLCRRVLTSLGPAPHAGQGPRGWGGAGGWGASGAPTPPAKREDIAGWVRAPCGPIPRAVGPSVEEGAFLAPDAFIPAASGRGGGTCSSVPPVAPRCGAFGPARWRAGLRPFARQGAGPGWATAEARVLC